MQNTVRTAGMYLNELSVHSTHPPCLSCKKELLLHQISAHAYSFLTTIKQLQVQKIDSESYGSKTEIMYA